MGFVRAFNSLDLGKFVFAFAVIAIHTNPLIACNNIHITILYEVLVRFAVPFFFVTSGYLLAAKFIPPLYAQENTLRVQTQLQKILKMYIGWTLVYAPLAIGHFISTNTPIHRAFLIYLRGFIFVGEQYNSWPLWYLLATIYALTLLWIVFKLKLSFKLLFCVWLGITITSIGFDFLVKTNSASFQLQLLQTAVKYTTGNGRIFQGITYIPLGILLYYKQLPRWFNWCLFLSMALALGLTTNNIILQDCLRIVGTVGLFTLIKNIQLQNRPLYPFLRNTSIFIYLIHMYIWTLYYTLVYGTKTYGLDSFIITSLLSFLTASCWTYLKMKKSALIQGQTQKHL